MSTRFQLKSLLRPEISALRTLIPHASPVPVRLDSNEAPALLSPEAHTAVERMVSSTPWNRYPDPRATELRAVLAARTGVLPDEIFVGAGSDEIIALLLTALGRPRDSAHAASIVIPVPSFLMYGHNAQARGMRVLDVPLDGAWDLDVSAMCYAIKRFRPNIVFLGMPNNPTGALFTEERVSAVIKEASESLVVLDEAYVDFSSRDHVRLRNAYPNVAILRTLSKVGFASLRVGWLIGAPDLVGELDKVRSPYNLSAPAQRAATLILRDLGPEIERIRNLVIAERCRLEADLGQLGFGVTPSEANFVWIKSKQPAQEIIAALALRGVAVRGFANDGRLAHQIRITVGTPEENSFLLAEIAACA